MESFKQNVIKHKTGLLNLAAELLGCLHDTLAVSAALQRLKSAQCLAKELFANGMVKDDTTWSSPETLKQACTSFRRALDSGTTTHLAQGVNGKLYTKGFFARDILSHMDPNYMNKLIR